MSDKDERSEAGEASVESFQNTGRAEPEGEIEQNGAPQAEESDVLRGELEQAQTQVGELKDRLLRTSAEMENVRKRAERDVANARKYALEKFAADLLSVRDSLEMGIASAREEGREEGSADKHVEGMELTLKMLVGSMEKFGITQMDPQGETFNPEYHEAVSMQESAEAKPNTVLHVMQKGYLLNDRVLRPAMVVVARAPASNS